MDDRNSEGFYGTEDGVTVESTNYNSDNNRMLAHYIESPKLEISKKKPEKG